MVFSIVLLLTGCVANPNTIGLGTIGGILGGGQVGTETGPGVWEKTRTTDEDLRRSHSSDLVVEGPRVGSETDHQRGVIFTFHGL